MPRARGRGLRPRRLQRRAHDLLRSPGARRGAGGRGRAPSLSAAAARLRPQQRAALALSGLEGLSYAEIATVLGIGVEGVGALLARAPLPYDELHGTALAGAAVRSPDCEDVVPLGAAAADGELGAAHAAWAAPHVEPLPDLPAHAPRHGRDGRGLRGMVAGGAAWRGWARRRWPSSEGARPRRWGRLEPERAAAGALDDAAAAALGRAARRRAARRRLRRAARGRFGLAAPARPGGRRRRAARGRAQPAGRRPAGQTCVAPGRAQASARTTCPARGPSAARGASRSRWCAPCRRVTAPRRPAATRRPAAAPSRPPASRPKRTPDPAPAAPAPAQPATTTTVPTPPTPSMPAAPADELPGTSGSAGDGSTAGAAPASAAPASLPFGGRDGHDVPAARVGALRVRAIRERWRPAP